MRHRAAAAQAFPCFVPRRFRLGAMVAGLALLTTVAVACGGLTRGSTPTPIRLGAASQYAGVKVLPAFPLPSFSLTDTSGQPYNFAQRTKGKFTLLYFGYTHCPDVCPATMASVAGALRQLPPGIRDRVTVAFVTDDPARDTPTVLRTWLDSFDQSFIGLTGSQQTIDSMMAAVGLPAPVKQGSGTNYTIGHDADLLAFTPDNLAHIEYPPGFPISDLVHDLKLLIPDGWKQG